MIHKVVSLGGLLLLAGAAALVTPGLGQARGFRGGYVGTGYNGSYGAVTLPYTYGSLSIASASDSPRAPDARARITLNVPAGARVWFDGTPTTATGSVRQFSTPPLRPDARYAYVVQARWNENGRDVTQALQVEVLAGDHVNLTFPVQE
jgi:uncharacterized protein (TIGR03000 family)